VAVRDGIAVITLDGTPVNALAHAPLANCEFRSHEAHRPVSQLNVGR
jgi:hypothetical protein